MNHTPGPWVVKGGHMIATDGGELIAAAELYAFLPGREDQAEANARLIAAAPDLLAAVVDILEFDEMPDRDYQFVIERCFAAVAKARGEAVVS